MTTHGVLDGPTVSLARASTYDTSSYGWRARALARKLVREGESRSTRPTQRRLDRDPVWYCSPSATPRSSATCLWAPIVCTAYTVLGTRLAGPRGGPGCAFDVETGT